MSTPTIQLERVDDQAERLKTLGSEMHLTIVAYLEKEAIQAATIERYKQALKTARSRRLPPPARSIEDDLSLHDEGAIVPTLVELIRNAAPQSFTPKLKQLKQWEIPDLKHPLRVTKCGKLTRSIPSVVKANDMQEEIPLDHPWVEQQYDEILRGLEIMRVALDYDQ